jgi:hypothetical protein
MMAVTQTESGLLDATSTAILLHRLNSEGKLHPVFDEAMGDYVFVDLETGKVNMTEGRPVFRIDTNWEGSNYLTIDPDLIEAVASMSSKMSQVYRHATHAADNRLVSEEDLTHRAYDRLVGLIWYINKEGA